MVQTQRAVIIFHQLPDDLFRNVSSPRFIIKKRLRRRTVSLNLLLDPKKRMRH